MRVAGAMLRRAGSRCLSRAAGAALASALVLASVAMGGTAGGGLDATRFQAHCQVLTAMPHRLAGTPEGGQAATYIESQLRALPGQFFEQRFSFPQQIIETCELRLLPDGPAISLFPLHANGLQPSVTPRAGLTGQLLYVGRGTENDLTGKEIKDNIILADVYSDADVVNTVFRLGARAIVFVEGGDEKLQETGAMRTRISIDLPRFYVTRAAAERGGLLAAMQPGARMQATLISQVRWQKRTGRNLFLWIPGQNPVFKGDNPEYIILSAYYDTGGIVPHLSPGAEAAANCAALLEIARQLAHNPPRRSVLIAFFDNHANFLEGGRHFYAALRRSLPKGIEDPLPVRREYVAQERKFLEAMLRFLAEPDLFAAENRIKVFLKEVEQRLRPVAKKYQPYERQLQHWDRAIAENARERQRLDKAASDLEALRKEKTRLEEQQAKAVADLPAERREPKYLEAEQERLEQAIRAAEKEIARQSAEVDADAVKAQKAKLQAERDRIAKTLALMRDLARITNAIRTKEKDIERLQREGRTRETLAEEAKRLQREREAVLQASAALRTKKEQLEAELARWSLVKDSINDGLLMLAEEAKYQYEDYQAQLTQVRLQIIRRQKAEKDTAVLEQAKVHLENEWRLWQRVREALRDRRAPVPEAQAYFQRAISNLATRLKNRQAELDEIEQQLDDADRLTAPLREATATFHISLRFSAGSDHWLFIPHGTLHRRLYATLLDKVGGKGGEAARGFVWESRKTWESEASTLSATAYSPRQTIEEAELANVFDIPAITLITEQDREPVWERPYSLADLERVRQQATHFLDLLQPLVTADWASVANRMLLHTKPYIEDYLWRKDANKAEGHQVRSFAYGATTAYRAEVNVPVHIWCQRNEAKYPDRYVLTDSNGCFPLLTVFKTDWAMVHAEAARFDEDGRINALSICVPGGGRGSVTVGWDKAGYYGHRAFAGHYALVAMFSGATGKIIGTNLPFADRFQPGAFRILSGLSNAPYRRLHFRYDASAGLGVYCVEQPMGVKFIYKDPRRQDGVALYIQPTAENPRGIGYGPGVLGSDEPGDFTLDMLRTLAPDLYALNDQRLEALRQRNIILNFYEDLHRQAAKELDRARDAEQRQHHAEADVRAAVSALFSERVYTPVVSTTNDMVVAVTVLLILTIPFAFSLQSLMLATYSVYRKIAGFVFFFLLSFLVLYFTHPAFSFAPTPIIIFLAFFIIVMSSVVIWIIADKFRYEVKKLQGLAVAAHTFERSFLSNLGAAVSLAFSTMRRRPVRTGLTVITALLLTFTILSFVAFQTERGINRFYLGTREGDQASRLLLRRKVWRSLDYTVLNHLRALLAPGAQVHGCYWKVRELTTELNLEPLYIPIRRVGGGTSVAGGMMSLDPLEIEHVRGIREALPGRIEDFCAGKGVYLAESLASELKAQPGDPLLIEGEQLTFLGVFDSRRLQEMRHIDGSPMLPVNFAMTRLAIGAMGTYQSKGSAGGGADALAELEADLAQLEAQALEPISPEALIIVPTALAERMKMSLKAIIVHPGADEDLDKLGARLALFNDDGVFLNKGGETSFYLYGEKLGIAGATDVLVPLILGGLIVFSTMLGSVIDREREIYTFSALGLAPRNIAMLFFVEAGIYAIIGGFGGYLLSQVVTRVLELLAAYGFKAPEMNYSSSTAIITILIVMATVIVSTIYPALQAARKATAETTKRWRIPPPQGDQLSFNFPFTISRYDITGIICFIREHFANHADRTVGKFAADDVEIFREPVHGMAALRATIWLQPFDQGISQGFQLSAAPSDIPEVCEVHIKIERRSGPPSAWKRSNTIFLEDLRAQFLLWRTLDDEVRDYYLGIAESLEATLLAETRA